MGGAGTKGFYSKAVRRERRKKPPGPGKQDTSQESIPRPDWGASGRKAPSPPPPPAQATTDLLPVPAGCACSRFCRNVSAPEAPPCLASRTEHSTLRPVYLFASNVTSSVALPSRRPTTAAPKLHHPGAGRAAGGSRFLAAGSRSVHSSTRCVWTRVFSSLRRILAGPIVSVCVAFKQLPP